MPINNILGTPYKVDYRSLKKELLQLPIFFDDAQIQIMYIAKWIEVLEQADINTCRSYMDLANQKNIAQENMEAPEKYQTVIKYNSNELYLHFRVSRMLQIIKASNSQRKGAQAIDISEFTKGKQINWTPTNDGIYIKSDPIIIVPFTIGKNFKMLVVDGNHRITDAIHKGKKIVDAYVLDANYIVQNELFCSQFDKMLYIFQNEIVAVATWKKRDEMSDQEILSKVYFNSGVANVEC